MHVVMATAAWGRRGRPPVDPEDDSSAFMAILVPKGLSKDGVSMTT